MGNQSNLLARGGRAYDIYAGDKFEITFKAKDNKGKLRSFYIASQADRNQPLTNKNYLKMINLEQQIQFQLCVILMER